MTPDDPNMRDKDRTCFTFQPACLRPNSCATNDDRQMEWMEWILMEVSRLRSGGLSKQKKKLPIQCSMDL